VQFGGYLRSQDVLDEPKEDALRAEVKQEIDEAIKAAWDAADPDPDSALRHVFHEEGS
jgi:2-oxoisovalerate dehydrogenase E1 component alpha subunit